MPITKTLQVAEPASIVAGKNFVINGAFDFWQRGTSFTTNYIYTADRWYYLSTTATGRTISRQLTNDSTNLPNIQYCARLQRNSGNTATNGLTFSQPIETVNSIPLAGKTVTLSFYARVGTGSSSTSINVFLCTGTGTDQNQQLTGYTGQALPISAVVTATTSWQRFTFTTTVSNTATEVQPVVEYVPVGTAGANDYLEVTGFQLELGNVATSFSRAQGTYQGELAACQRYYIRYNANGETNYCIPGHGGANSSTQTRVLSPLPVQMRVKPTAIDSSAASTFYVYSFADGAVQCSSIVLDSNLSSANLGWVMFNVASGLTSNSPYYVRANNTSSAYLGFSAEL